MKIIRVAPPKHVAGSVGRHRAPAADEVTRTTRTARTLVDGTLDTVGSLATRGSTPSAGKISGRLTDVVGGTASTHRIGPGVPDLPVLLLPSPELPALRLPGVQLPGVQFPGVQLPGLELPGLSPEFGQPVPVLPGAPVPGLTAGTVAERILAGHHVRFSSTFQGLTGTAPSHLSRVALPDAPSAPAAPRGPRPTGPVPAPPAGTGAGAAVDLTTLWAVPAPIAGLTPSGLSTLVAGRTGPAPRDLAGMPLITPD